MKLNMFQTVKWIIRTAIYMGPTAVRWDLKAPWCSQLAYKVLQGLQCFFDGPTVCQPYSWARQDCTDTAGTVWVWLSWSGLDIPELSFSEGLAGSVELGLVRLGPFGLAWGWLSLSGRLGCVFSGFPGLYRKKGFTVQFDADFSCVFVDQSNNFYLFFIFLWEIHVYFVLLHRLLFFLSFQLLLERFLILSWYKQIWRIH